MSRRVEVAVQLSDVTKLQADAVVVRYTSGAAGAVAQALGLRGESLQRALPSIGSLHVFPGNGRIAASAAAFFRAVPASSIDPAHVRRFSGEVLRNLRAALPDARHLGMTLQGVAFGLRLSDSLRAQLDGWKSGLAAGEFPPALERITIVADSEEQIGEIERVLGDLLPERSLAAGSPERPPASAAPAGGLGNSFDVFISFKSEDSVHAAAVYEFLTSKGLRAFFSRESLPQMGSAEYHAEIDKAIEKARHMVVVTSSRRNASSKWVEYEWRLFLGERLAGRKAGNLMTVLAAGMRIEELPISLRNREAIPCEASGLERLLEYLRADKEVPAPASAARPEPSVSLPRVGQIWVAAEQRRKDVSWTVARQGLETLTLGGRTGWRLPSVMELRRIREAGLLPPELCWWSCEEAGPDEARYMHFDDGHLGQGPKSYANGLCAVLVNGPGS